MSTQTPLEQLIQATDNHGEDSGDPDHTVGDLQDLLRKAWSMLTVSQQIALLQSEEAAAVVESGGRGDFDVDSLALELELPIKLAQADLVAAGYEFHSFADKGLYFWTAAAKAGPDFKTRLDAIEDALKDSLKTRN